MYGVVCVVYMYVVIDTFFMDRFAPVDRDALYVCMYVCV
jgi:hypothetical protein